MNRIDPAKPLSDCHRVVGTIWRSRHEELEQEVFDQFPRWMQPEQTDYDMTTGLTRVMAPLIDGLMENESRVIYYRFWYDMTLEEIGNVLGVTRERIRQIERRALLKMMHPKRSDFLKDFY